MRVTRIQNIDTCTMNAITVFQVKHIQQILRFRYMK